MSRDTAPRTEDVLPIGEVARRAGFAASALRYYESEGLITGTRTGTGQRRYPRSVLRRLAFVRAAQNVGLSLDEIRDALATLPDSRVPTKADWARLSSSWRSRLDDQIAGLMALRDGSDHLHRLWLPVAAPLRPVQPRRLRRRGWPRCAVPSPVAPSSLAGYDIEHAPALLLHSCWTMYGWPLAVRSAPAAFVGPNVKLHLSPISDPEESIHA